MYSERPSALAGGVVWTQAADPVAASTRVLPDACMDLIWHDGRLLVAGPDTTAQVVYSGTRVSFTGLRFAPGSAPSVLGVPGHALRDMRVELDALWPSAEVRRLTDLVASAPDPGVALERVIRERLGMVGPASAWTASAVRPFGTYDRAPRWPR